MRVNQISDICPVMPISTVPLKETRARYTMDKLIKTNLVYIQSLISLPVFLIPKAVCYTI
jgi:hypothetical protein